jgi:uncharacterized protein YwqG
MELVYGLVPLALLVVAAVAIKLFGDWFDRRRARRRAAEAGETGDAVPHKPRGTSADAALPGAGARDDAPGIDVEAVAASRLARIRAARNENSAPYEPYDAPDAPDTSDAPAAPAAPAVPAPQPAAAQGEESVTAVLRRQVPLRDEPPRSWLGGLPMMPEDVEWPRGVSEENPDAGEIPLHFLAQIACEDLPADLWGGLGPRTGWLLFFINPNDGTAEGEGMRRVLYTTELGTERQPPFDCGPVHDKVYTGGSYNWLAAEDVPAFWRRWPVDIVAMPNALTLHEEDGSTWKTASPDNLSDILYADVPYSKTKFSNPMPRLRPLTFGQARDSVEALAQSLRYKVRAPVDDAARELLLADGGHARLMADLEANRERLAAMPPEELEPQQVRRIAFLEAAIPEYAAMDAEAVLSSIEARHAEWLVWREKIAGGCDQIAAMLAKSGADAPLSDDYWRQLQATFAGKHFDHLELRHSRFRDRDFPVSLMSPRETIELKLPKGMDQIAIEYYLDPAHRDQLPADWAASQEPAWRALYNNRPHRMGGYHDGLQSEPIEDPAFGQMLLMQIATDDAMDWCWGDGGVYFFWIRPEHLEACDFSGVEVWLECH